MTETTTQYPAWQEKIRQQQTEARKRYETLHAENRERAEKRRNETADKFLKKLGEIGIEIDRNAIEFGDNGFFTLPGDPRVNIDGYEIAYQVSSRRVMVSKPVPEADEATYERFGPDIDYRVLIGRETPDAHCDGAWLADTLDWIEENLPARQQRNAEELERLELIERSRQLRKAVQPTEQHLTPYKLLWEYNTILLEQKINKLHEQGYQLHSMNMIVDPTNEGAPMWSIAMELSHD